MANLSNYLENLLAKFAFTAQAAPRPTTWHVALFSTAPSDAGGGTELTGGGYARQSATFTVTDNLVANAAELNFVSTADWPNITHVGVFDAATGGNLLLHGALASARNPNAGDTVRFGVAQLQLTID